MMRSDQEVKTILNLLKQHQSYSEKEFAERLESLKTDENVFTINDANGELSTCLEIKPWDSHAHGSSASLCLVYTPDLNNQLMAEQLLKTHIERLNDLGVKMLMMPIAEYDTDLFDIACKQSFNAWYGYVYMKHDGRKLAASRLSKRTILSEDFESYHETMGHCFVAMRQAMSILPFNVIDQLFKDEHSKQATREAWLKHTPFTWMYYDEKQWVGSGLIVDGDIDDVFIKEDLQGQGYGREILLDLVHEVYQRGLIPTIGYVKWNVAAGRLYDSLGFEPYLSVNYVQRFL